jgi:tetratricopeptide (TPR) repeat protein
LRRNDAKGVIWKLPISLRLSGSRLLRAMVGAAALAPAWAAAQVPAGRGPAQTRIEGLSAADLFGAADRAIAASRPQEALAFYDAMTRDPDLEIRTEARFRRGMLLADLGRLVEAAASFRALLDEKPDALRARLELARVLALLGLQAEARRELRQAQAGPLPREVALVIDQFARALQSAKRAGGSFSVAVAPDTNINRATASRTLDTIIAPLVLSDDARARSGIGISYAGQAYAKLPIGRGLALVPRVSSGGYLYRDSQFDDVSASALLGVEYAAGADRISPSAGISQRWYGGDVYARSAVVAVDFVHPLNKRTQLIIAGSLNFTRYLRNDLQSGTLFDLNLSVEHALDPRTAIGMTASATRQAAKDPGYATTAGGLSVFVARELGRATLSATIGLRRTEGDARLFLFPAPRREWLVQAQAAGVFRQLAWHGFAPMVRLRYERNSSTVGLYEYRRLSTELGIARAF